MLFKYNKKSSNIFYFIIVKVLKKQIFSFSIDDCFSLEIVSLYALIYHCLWIENYNTTLSHPSRSPISFPCLFLEDLRSLEKRWYCFKFK